MHKFTDAIEYYKKAVTKQPKHVWLSLALADLHMKLGTHPSPNHAPSRHARHQAHPNPPRAQICPAAPQVVRLYPARSSRRSDAGASRGDGHEARTACVNRWWPLKACVDDLAGRFPDAISVIDAALDQLKTQEGLEMLTSRSKLILLQAQVAPRCLSARPTFSCPRATPPSPVPAPTPLPRAPSLCRQGGSGSAAPARTMACCRPPARQRTVPRGTNPRGTDSLAVRQVHKRAGAVDQYTKSLLSARDNHTTILARVRGEAAEMVKQQRKVTLPPARPRATPPSPSYLARCHALSLSRACSHPAAASLAAPLASLLDSKALGKTRDAFGSWP